MSTPYWGQLPGPKIVNKNLNLNVERRMSDDDKQTFLDVPAALNPRANRSSIHTQVTDAPTETTFSPSYDSPTVASFAHGLAPPSYQTTHFPQDPTTRSSRLQPIEYDDEQHEASFRHQVHQRPQGHDSSTLTHPYSAAAEQYPQHSRAAPPSISMESYEQQFALNAPRQRDYGYATTADSSRRPSGTSSGRRRESADHKSPLQRLELTLGRMTKEEKRARMEAAERRARERQARKAQEEAESREAQRHVEEYRAEPAPVAHEPVVREGPYYREHHIPRELPVQKPPHVMREAAIQRDPQIPRDGIHRESGIPRDTQRYREPPGGIPERRESLAAFVPQQRQQYSERPQTAVSRQQTQISTRAPEPDSPRRNLSFRERTVHNDNGLLAVGAQQVPVNDPTLGTAYQQQQQPAAKKGFGFSLVRSGSNKLRKGPPSEGAHQDQHEIQERIPVVSHHGLAKPGLHQPQNATPRANMNFSASSRRTQPHDPLDMLAAEAASQAPGSSVQSIQHHGTETSHGTQEREQNQKFDSSMMPAPQFRDRVVRYDENFGVTASQTSDAAKQESIYSDYLHMIRPLVPGEGLYKPTVWLEDWKTAEVGILSGSLLNVHEETPSTIDKNKPWWEDGGRKRSTSFGAGPRAPGAFSAEYSNPTASTHFTPPLHLECGPLMRYCGIRHDTITTRTPGIIADREMWRGSVMIVTRDSESSYDIAPTLRIFVQDMELLPRAPHTVDGDLSPEYVDPISGHPKLGRKGETLYVRPVEHLEEAVDLSGDESGNGLFESKRSPPDVAPTDGSSDHPGTFTSRIKRVTSDGEKSHKYRDLRGFRLHAERGCTFWRFNIEVELRDHQQRIAYRINRGPSMAFWVPAHGKAMNVMFHSSNGFSADVQPDSLGGPDPMWRDVLNTHQSTPFHVMIGGGDQICNDTVLDECDLLSDWVNIRDRHEKDVAPFTTLLQKQLEDYHFQRYCHLFSSGMFGLANSQIPMVNMWSSREAFNSCEIMGYGDRQSPVLAGLNAIAFKYYMLFQHQSIMPETEETEPSWILGTGPGSCSKEPSRSLYMSLGSKVSVLAADCQTERTDQAVIDDGSWEKIVNELYNKIKRGQVEHLLVVFSIPVAFPRLDVLENMFKSKLQNPFTALGRKALFGNVDDAYRLNADSQDHWTAKNHKDERSIIVEDLQDLAIDKSLRVTILSGSVNMAALGQFHSNTKMGLAKHNDPRYMVNIVSSGIANEPVTDWVADALDKQNKTLHFDQQTDESMIPIFQHGVDGGPRINSRLLPHRNWCSIRQWEPGHTPPPTPPTSRSPSPLPPARRGSILRRFSLSKERPEISRVSSVRGPKPPISASGLSINNAESQPPKVGLLRRLSLSSQRPSLPKDNMSRDSVRGSRPPISGSGHFIPSQSQDDASMPPAGGLFRRLSLSSERPNISRDSVRGPKPPISRGGGLLRSLSRRLSKGKDDAERPDSELRRTMSLDYENAPKERRGFFGLGRRGSQSQKQVVDSDVDSEWGPANYARRGAGGMTQEWEHQSDPRSSHRAVVNGQWDSEGTDRVYSAHRRWDDTDDEYVEYQSPPLNPQSRPLGLRGGGLSDEYSDGDESRFTAAPSQVARPEDQVPPQALRPFHRMPTGLELEKIGGDAQRFQVDLDGGLDICLNAEVNPLDPAGITVPYRLIVPKLFYEYNSEDDEIPPHVAEQQQATTTTTGTGTATESEGFKRLLSFRKKETPAIVAEMKHPKRQDDDEHAMEDMYDDEYDEDEDNFRDEREEVFLAVEEAYQKKKLEERGGGGFEHQMHGERYYR